MRTVEELIELKRLRLEQKRQLIVNLVLVIYWLMILEGALRKWIAPRYYDVLLAIKDPIVLYIYFLAIPEGLYIKKNRVVSYGFFLFYFLMFFGIVQYGVLGINPIVVGYGWRNYCLYLPLIFVIGENFKGNDLRRLIKHTLLLAIPMSFLVYKQFSSPLTDIVNLPPPGGAVYTIEHGTTGFTARPTGTFSSYHGQQMFAGSLSACLIATWILPPVNRPLNAFFLWISTIAVMTNIFLTGTRAPLLLAFSILSAAWLGSFIVKDRMIRLRSRVIPIAITVLGILVLTMFYDKALELVKKRSQSSGAASIESTISRSFYQITSFWRFVGYFRNDPIGFGMAHTSRPGRFYVASGEVPRTDEDEWSRIIGDLGPYAGLAFIFFRIWLTWQLIAGAINAAKRSSNPTPILLAAFTAPVFLFWYATHIVSVHDYAWLFAGFCMAANRLGMNMQSEDTLKQNPWN